MAEKLTFKITGVIEQIMPIESGISEKSGTEWQHRDIIIRSINRDVTQKFCMNLFGASCKNVIIKEGNIIEFYFNVDARYVPRLNKWFTSLHVWKMNLVGSEGDGNPEEVHEAKNGTPKNYI